MSPSEHKAALLHAIGRAIHCAKWSGVNKTKAGEAFDNLTNITTPWHLEAMMTAQEVMPAVEAVIGPAMQRENYLRRHLLAIEVRDIDGSSVRLEVKAGREPLDVIDHFARPELRA